MCPGGAPAHLEIAGSRGDFRITRPRRGIGGAVEAPSEGLTRLRLRPTRPVDKEAPVAEYY
jgi:hypothetical protein